jgi:predicted alpha/beta superfamily hydrolase
MLKIFSTLAGLLPVLSLAAQLTINVNTVPVNTPPGASIHLAGSFNNWNPGDPNTIMAALGNGQYTLTINPAPGTLEFKFTRGSWATVEGNANGGFLPNRTYAYNGQPSTLNLSILSWEDLGGTGGGGTAADNVYLLDNNFFMPQLNRSRRIWIYLPPDYQSSSKSYPVLYMHDGQNLFDAATSAFGEWEVDESLNELFEQGDYGCIVVGIDNGGALRLNEYSPWVNPQYGGGEGDAYIDFIVETLKPHIDANYRTLPGRSTTGIMGSSMGGLISMYGLAEHQDVFSKAGIFSPAFWFAGAASANHVSTTGKEADVRVYFLAGGQEPASVAQNMYVVRDAMWNAGFGTNETYDLVPADGQHSEWFWRREFPAAYQWLFAGAVSSTVDAPAGRQLVLFPNPAGDTVTIGGLEGLLPARLKIVDAGGRTRRNTTLRNAEAVDIRHLRPGVYTVQVRGADGRVRTGQLVKG